MSKTIVLANHKGGVCKTTLTLSLADAFSRDGLSVLVVDMDPQANATSLLYSTQEPPATPIEKVLDDSSSIAEAILQNTKIDGVHLIGSTIRLHNLDREMAQTPFSSTSALSDKLKAVADVYDVILIDSPPALNHLTANALTAADAVFVPVVSGSKMSLLGTDDLVRFIKLANRSNPRLRFGGAILTHHDARKTMCKIGAGAIKSFYPHVLDATFPPTTDMLKAQAAGQTILQFDRDHTASRNVIAMAREIAGLTGLTPKTETEAVDHA